MSVWSCLVTGLKHLQWFSLVGTAFWTVLPLAFNIAYYLYFYLVIQPSNPKFFLIFDFVNIVPRTGLFALTPVSLYLVSSKGAASDLLFAKNLAPPCKPGLLVAAALSWLMATIFNFLQLSYINDVLISLAVVEVVLVYVYLLGMATVTGCLVATFNKECQAIAALDIDKRLEAVRRFVFKFRGLKTGLQLCLLNVFTTNTVLVIMSAYELSQRLTPNCIFVDDIVTPRNLYLVCFLASNLLLLVYYAAVMDSCYQSFQGLAQVLR